MELCFLSFGFTEISEKVNRDLPDGYFDFAVPVTTPLHVKQFNCSQASFPSNEGKRPIISCAHDDGVEQRVGTDTCSKICQTLLVEGAALAVGSDED